MSSIDNTLKTLGFIYQAYIGLIICLELDPNEKLVMEHLGDVTKISTSSMSQQIEVKHHVDEVTLSDRSLEIWNTVWNWYNNSNDYLEIDELILFTTGKLSQKSSLREWHTMNLEQRYLVFKAIGETVKNSEVEFRKIYEKIFSTTHDSKKLMSILKRFKIVSEQRTIKTIIDHYYKSTFKFLGDKERIEEFISALIGMLLTIPVKQKKWELSGETFIDLFKKFADRFTDNPDTPLQLTYEDYVPNAPEQQKLQKKRFVAEIQRIDMPDEITEAINDYCKTNKTIIKYFETNIVRSKDLKDYRKQLQKTLLINKKMSKLDCKADSEKFIPNSQKLYLESMVMEARKISGISNNRDFFQRGVIHSIVDEEEFTWHIGDQL